VEKEKRRWKSRQIRWNTARKNESLPRAQHHCLVADRAEGGSKTDGHSEGEYRKEAQNESEKSIYGWPLKQVTHVKLARRCKTGNTTGSSSHLRNGVKPSSTREREAQYE
jgi:hypothetical protein